MKIFFETNKKIILSIAITILILCLMSEVVLNLVIYKKANNNFLGNITNIMSDSNTTLVNQIIEDDMYIVTNNDPNITITLDKPTKIGCVILKFKKPLTKIMNIQIFYAKKDEYFTGENTKSITVKAGTTQVNLNIPVQNYSFIRLDIGDTTGEAYSLLNVEASDINEKEYITDFNINIIRLFIFALFYLLIIALIMLVIPRPVFKNLLILLQNTIKSQSIVIDLLFLIFLTIIFFSIMPILSFDSFWYHTYLDIFNGNKVITDWDPTRGLPFPLLIFISTKLFGYTTQGITITLYIFYIITIFSVFKICKICGFKYNKILLWVILLITLFLNPIYLGYYHLVLTEFVVSTLLIVYMCIVIYTHNELNNMDIERNKKIFMYFIRVLSLIIISVVSFFVKQMYYVIILLPFIASEFLILRKKFYLKRLLYCVISIAISVIMLVGFNSEWNQIIDIENSRNIFGMPFSNSSAFSTSISTGLRYFVPSNLNDITSDEINVNVVENNHVKSCFIAPNPNKGIKNALEYTLKCILESPSTAVKGYIDNYLVITNIYHFKDIPADYGRGEIIKDFNLFHGRENNYLACSPIQMLNIDSMVYNGQFDDQFYIPYGNQYKQKFDTNLFIKVIYKDNYIKFANFLYSLTSLLALPIMIISLIIISRKKKYNNLHSMNFIYSFTIFFHILQLAVLGQNIDRYAFPIYTICVLLVINYLIILVRFIQIKYIKR